MKIAVAIPVYDGKLPVETVRCLIDEQSVIRGSGDSVSFIFLPGCSHPAMGRNQLARLFMESDADRLVFLDSDVTFEPGALLRIARHPVDFVGGAYRYKLEAETYPVGWLLDDLWSDKNGLLEVLSLPGGFMSLSRKVFETLKDKHPDRQYEHMGNRFHVYFSMPWQDGSFYGEDSYFCKQWREAGGKVFLDPELSLTHWNGNTPFHGHVGKWLKSRPKEV